MYYKRYDRQNFYSTLCYTAKRNQRYNLIQSTQNDSTSVEHNSKTLTPNKIQPRQPIQKSNGPRPAPKPNYFYLSSLSSRLKIASRLATHRLYIEKDHVTQIYS